MTTRYSKDHEWIRVEGDEGTIGITEYAQEQLGDIVYIELPKPGKAFNREDQIAVVESVKAASEVYAPVAGEVTAVNERLADEPTLVNQSPTGDGWFLKLRLADKSQLEALMEEDAYKDFVASQ